MWISKKKYNDLMDELEVLRNPDSWIDVLEDNRFIYVGSLQDTDKHLIIYNDKTLEGAKQTRIYTPLKLNRYLNKSDFRNFLSDGHTLTFHTFPLINCI